MHGYGSCATCHVDPSGSGQLTDYGRAQDDILVKWRTQPRKDDEELPKTVGFLWFAELPDWLNLSGNLRYGSLIRPQSGPKFLGGYYIPLLMAADLYVTLNFGPVVAHASTGIGIRNTGPATILPLRDASASGSYTPTWIAREFWLGVNLADDSVMIRAGRQNLPFGLRNSEHTSYVRALTRTDFNISQQVAVAYVDGTPVKVTLTSTGTIKTLANGTKQDNRTELGVWKIYYRLPKQDMKGGSLASGDYYDLKDVPYPQYFHISGEALHGTYWHDDFGRPHSHGCVNLSTPMSEWFYNWDKVGTIVYVHN